MGDAARSKGVHREFVGCALEAAAEGKSIAHVAEEQGEVKQDNGDKATSTRT